MDMEQLKQDVAEGKVSLNRLVDLIASQQKLIEKIQKQIAELQEKLDGKNPTERLDEPYSEKSEEKRQGKGKRRKPRKSSRKGRISTLAYQITVMFYGVHKDGDTLQQILDKEVFDGVLVSDDASIYRGFSKSQ